MFSKKVLDLLKVFDSVHCYMITKFDSISLENERQRMICVGLSIFGPLMPGPGMMYSLYPSQMAW